MDVVADLAERYSFGEVRVTHAQNVVLPHVLKADLYAVWQALVEAGLADVNLDLVTDIIACPGLDYRSEEHTSELQSLMRISYAVFCLKKKTKNSTLQQLNIIIIDKTQLSSSNIDTYTTK